MKHFDKTKEPQILSVISQIKDEDDKQRRAKNDKKLAQLANNTSMKPPLLKSKRPDSNDGSKTERTKKKSKDIELELIVTVPKKKDDKDLANFKSSKPVIEELKKVSQQLSIIKKTDFKDIKNKSTLVRNKSSQNRSIMEQKKIPAEKPAGTRSTTILLPDNYLKRQRNKYLGRKTATNLMLQKPEFNIYIGENTFRRTEDEYKEKLEEIKAKKQLMVNATLRSKSNLSIRRDNQRISDGSYSNEPVVKADPKDFEIRNSFQAFSSYRNISSQNKQVAHILETEKSIERSQGALDEKKEMPVRKSKQRLTMFDFSQENSNEGKENPLEAKKDQNNQKKNFFEDSSHQFPRTNIIIESNMSDDQSKSKEVSRANQKSSQSMSESPKNRQSPKMSKFVQLKKQNILKSSLTNQLNKDSMADECDCSKNKILMNEENPVQNAGELPPSDRTVTRFSLKVNKTLEMLNDVKQTEDDDEFGNVGEVDTVNVQQRNKSGFQGKDLGAVNAVIGQGKFVDKSESLRSVNPFLSPAQMAASYATITPKLGEQQKKKLIEDIKVTVRVTHESKDYTEPKPSQLKVSKSIKKFNFTPLIQKGQEVIETKTSQKKLRTAEVTGSKLTQTKSEMKVQKNIIYERYLKNLETGNKDRVKECNDCGNCLRQIKSDKQIVLKDTPEIASASTPITSNYSTLPSSIKETKLKKDYTLRSSLNKLEPQLQKFKLRNDPKSHYQKQRESEIVAIFSFSVFGDTKFIDFSQQNIKIQNATQKTKWKNAISKENNKIVSKEVQVSKFQNNSITYLLQSHSQNIHHCILSFLEGSDPLGPSLDTFKLAMLNKKMMIIILKVYQLTDFCSFAANHAKQKMTKLLICEPDLDKYGRNTRGVKTVQAALQSPVFGGSIFSPINAARSGIGGLQERRLDGKKIEKRNQIKSAIAKMEIDVVNGGGFYTLKNVKASKTTFLDIQILIPYANGSQQDLQTMQKWHQVSIQDGKVLPTPKNQINLLNTGTQLQKSSKQQDKCSKFKRLFSPQNVRTVQLNLTKKEGQNTDQSEFVSLAQTPNQWSNQLRGNTSTQMSMNSDRARDQENVGSVKRKQYLPLSMQKIEIIDSSQSFPRKADFKQMLNGVARIIEYGTDCLDKLGNPNPTIDSKQNYILSLSEGQFENGLFSGFTRCIDSQGECMIGFWKINEQGRSRPYGKFASYFKDGSFKSPDGIYFGDEWQWNKLIKKQMNFDFLNNQEP